MDSNMKLKILLIFDICGSMLITLFGLLALLFYYISDYSYVSSIPKNWNSRPLFPSEAFNCFSNASLHAKLGEWPGIRAACDCSNDPFSFYQIYKRRCKSSIHEMAACNNIAAVKAIPYTKWRDLTFCQSMNVDLNYLHISEGKNSEYSIKISEKQCPAGSRSCGLIDSVDNVLCVAKSKECPVNYIKFIADGQTFQNDKNYTILPARGGNFAISNEFTTNKIITDFKVSDNQPCASPYYSNNNVSAYMLELNYGIDTCNKYIGEELYDKRYAYIDSETFKDLTIQNTIWNIIIKLSKYPQQAVNKTTNLYVRNYIGLKAGCLEEARRNVDFESFYQDMENIDADVSYIFGILIAALTISFLFCVFNVVVTCMGLSLNYSDAKGIASYIGLIIFFVPSLVLFSIAHSKLNDNKESVLLLDQSCVDTITYNASLNYYGKSGTVASFSYAAVAFLLINFISDVIKILFKNYIYSDLNSSQMKNLMIETNSVSQNEAKAS